MTKSKKSSRWYSVFRQGKGWTAAVIIGNPDNAPQILGRYATQDSAALAAYKHSKIRRLRADREARTAYLRARRKAYLTGRKRVRAAATAAVRRAYATHEARKRTETLLGWHQPTDFATALDAMGAALR